MTTYGRRRVIVLYLSIFNRGGKWKWVVNITLRPLYLRERTPTPSASDGLDHSEKRKHFAPAGIWAPDRPTRSLVTILTIVSDTDIVNVWFLNHPGENYNKSLTKAGCRDSNQNSTLLTKRRTTPAPYCPMDIFSRRTGHDHNAIQFCSV